MNVPIERKAPEKPDFDWDTITLLDALQKLIRELFFRRIVSHGGRRGRLVACMVFAYLTGPY
jgi:hypothetical protein